MNSVDYFDLIWPVVCGFIGWSLAEVDKRDGLFHAFAREIDTAASRVVALLGPVRTHESVAAFSRDEAWEPSPEPPTIRVTGCAQCGETGQNKERLCSSCIFRQEITRAKSIEEIVAAANARLDAARSVETVDKVTSRALAEIAHRRGERNMEHG